MHMGEVFPLAAGSGALGSPTMVSGVHQFLSDFLTDQVTDGQEYHSE